MKLLRYILNTILFISLTVIFIGCNNFQNELKTYNDIVEVELARDTVINEIFMGLNYGDSESTTRKKLRKLLNDKKLSRNENNQYVYEFSLEEDMKIWLGQVEAVVDLQFHNNKLYKLTLRASYDESVMSYIESKIIFMHSEISMRYFNKYIHKKYKYHRVKNKLIDDLDDYYYIYSNNQIKISSYINTVVTYTDLRMIKEIEIKEEKEIEIKNEETRKERIKQLNDL